MKTLEQNVDMTESLEVKQKSSSNILDVLTWGHVKYADLQVVIEEVAVDELRFSCGLNKKLIGLVVEEWPH